MNRKYNPYAVQEARKKISEALEALGSHEMSSLDKKLLRGLLKKKIEDEEDIEGECEDELESARGTLRAGQKMMQHRQREKQSSSFAKDPLRRADVEKKSFKEDLQPSYGDKWEDTRAPIEEFKEPPKSKAGDRSFNRGRDKDAPNSRESRKKGLSGLIESLDVEESSKGFLDSRKRTQI